MANAPRVTSPLGDYLKDLRTLERHAPADADMTPALARLTIHQIMEIERMAAQGLNLKTIATRLGIDPDVWLMIIKLNPEVDTAYRTGAARGADVVSASALRLAQGGDSAMVKYYLDRLVPEFKPAPAAPTVVVNTGPMVEIDQDAMAARFARQRALIDGTCDELGTQISGPSDTV